MLNIERASNAIDRQLAELAEKATGKRIGVYNYTSSTDDALSLADELGVNYNLSLSVNGTRSARATLHLSMGDLVATKETPALALCEALLKALEWGITDSTTCDGDDAVLTTMPNDAIFESLPDRIRAVAWLPTGHAVAGKRLWTLGDAWDGLEIQYLPELDVAGPVVNWRQSMKQRYAPHV